VLTFFLESVYNATFRQKQGANKVTTTTVILT